MAVGGARGEAVGGGAVRVRHARRRGPDSAFKACVRRGAGAWQPRGDGTLTGGPSAGSGG
jgi:hypothetical protein